MKRYFFHVGGVAKRVLENLGLKSDNIDSIAIANILRDEGTKTCFLVSLYSDLSFEILEKIHSATLEASATVGFILANNAEDLHQRISKSISCSSDIGPCKLSLKLITDIGDPDKTLTELLNQNINTAIERDVDLLYISTRSDGVSAFLGDRCLCAINSENWDEAAKELSCIGRNYCYRLKKSISKASVSKELIHPSKIKVKVLILGCCYGILPDDAINQARFSLLEQWLSAGVVDVIVTTWEILFSIESCFDELLLDIRSGQSVGKAVQKFNEAKEVLTSGQRLAIIGNPETAFSCSGLQENHQLI